MKIDIANFFKEPVVLFLLIGFAFYIIYTSISHYIDKSDRTIVISQEQVQLLHQNFQRTWNRPPTDDEMQAQITSLIKDEVFFREAVAMGLDKSDPAVKRRLRQLIELMMDDYATVYPSEDQLREYLEEHKEEFREDPRISFEQRYFPMEQKQEAEEILSKLKLNQPLGSSSDYSLSMLPNGFSDEPKHIVKRTFGEQFTDELFKLNTNTWEGPVASAYGWHLVFISKLDSGYVPDLDQIWDVVEREWSVEQRSAKKEEQFQLMKSNYIVQFEENE